MILFKSQGPSSGTFLTKWTHLTKGNLEYKWLLQRTFEIPNLISLELNWTTIAQKFPELSVMLILIGILKLLNIIRGLKLPLCKIKL